MKLRAFLLAIALASTNPALAAYVIDVDQSGNNVAMTGSGSFNLTGLFGNGSGNGGMVYTLAQVGNLIVGTGGYSIYSGFSGPANFSQTSFPMFKTASATTGPVVGIQADVNMLFVPEGYVSGAFFTSNAIYDNQTLASMNLKTGTYIWNWGNGATADSFTIRIGQSLSAVPEPHSWLTMFLGFGLIGSAMRHRKRQKFAARYV